MSKDDNTLQGRRTINRILGPDGTVWAREEIIHPQSPHDSEGGALSITVVRGTMRALPLTREEAEKWVNDVLADAAEDTRRAIKEDLCSGEPASLIDPTFVFLYDCVKAINHQDYATGFSILESGFEAIWNREEQPDGWEIVARCLAILRALREALQKSVYSAILGGAADEPGLECSFCHKRASEVEKVVAGSKANICNECVLVCSTLISGTE